MVPDLEISSLKFFAEFIFPFIKSCHFYHKVEHLQTRGGETTLIKKMVTDS